MDALGNATAFSVATPYVKLHTGDPGTAGTANPATETTRKAVSLTSDADVSWTNITGNQDANHFTCWDNISAGNFLFSGTIVAGAYTAGDTYTISAGNLTVSLTLAS
jgi:hypothetical protein